MFIFLYVPLSVCPDVVSFTDLVSDQHLVYSRVSLMEELIFSASLHQFLLSLSAMNDVMNHRGIKEHDVPIVFELLAKRTVAAFDINEDEALVGVVFNDSIFLPFFL